MELLAISIGVGLVISLIFAELFGLAAGGMIVPGYFALYMDHPMTILVTIGVSMITYLFVRVISSFIIIYGKRRTVLMVLVSYLLTFALQNFFSFSDMDIPLPEIRIIGYIVPGLIAIWLDRQGIIETLSALLIASTVVRLVLILAYGEDILI